MGGVGLADILRREGINLVDHAGVRRLAHVAELVVQRVTDRVEDLVQHLQLLLVEGLGDALQDRAEDLRGDREVVLSGLGDERLGHPSVVLGLGPLHGALGDQLGLLDLAGHLRDDLLTIAISHRLAELCEDLLAEALAHAVLLLTGSVVSTRAEGSGATAGSCGGLSGIAGRPDG